MTKHLIEDAVAELWYAGMGVNVLLQKVQEHLQSNESIKEEITKKQVKAAKLILPYTYTPTPTPTHNNADDSTNDSVGRHLSKEKIQFVNDKINERQHHRQSRRFKDADFIQRGLDKMGVVLNDAIKTWSYTNTSSDRDTLLLNLSKLSNQSNNCRDDNDNKNDNADDNETNEIRCKICGQVFKSRNLMFKHMRDPGSGCGNTIFATNQKLPTAPSIEKKLEKKKKAKLAKMTSTVKPRVRARTGKTAQHANSSSTVWIGDIPLPWTRIGGQHKRLRALIRQYLPRDVPQPWIKIVVRKGYRKRSELMEEDSNETQNGNIVDITTAPDEKKTNEIAKVNEKETRKKDEYLGYAIVVFRCDEEAEQVRKYMDGIKVCPKEVFRSDQMMMKNDNDQLSQIPTFTLKVRAAENGDSYSHSSTISPAAAIADPQTMKVSGHDPPLSEQLRPFTIDELNRRMNDMRITLHNNDNQGSNDAKTEISVQPEPPINQSQQHDKILEEVASLYLSISPKRKEIKSEGCPVPASITNPLLEILKSLRWSVPNERRHLTAERYLVLPTNVSNDRFYGDLREACKKLMDWADGSYFYSGIAVTKNFISSPHIDDRDQSYQYAISLGDFNGGELCVEGRTYNEENDTFEDYVNVVNTQNRIARVEGRHIHWVRSWDGGDRYSLIFYDTTDRFRSPVIEQGVCPSFTSN